MILQIPGGVSPAELSAEASARASADATLQANIDKKVSKAGDTMTGQLRFAAGTGNVIFESGIPSGGQPSATYQRVVEIRDAGNGPRGAIYMGSRAGDNHVLMRAYKSSSAFADMELKYDVASDKYLAFCPSSPVKDDEGKRINDKRIVTMEMAASDPGLVHTSGVETISGVKTFSASPIMTNFIYMSHTGVSAGVAPANDTYHDIRFTDKDNTMRHGMIRSWAKADGNNSLELCAFNLTERGNSLTLYANGQATLSVATPNSANGNEIVTAGWANSKFVNVAGDSMTGTLTMDAPSDSYNDIIFTLDSVRQGVIRAPLDGTARRIIMGVTSPSTNTLAYILQLYNAGGNPYILGRYRGFSLREANDVLCHGSIPDDSRIVHTTGAESIAGVKTFTSETVHSNRLTILNNAYLDSDNEKTISFRTSSGTVKGYVKIGTDYILKVRGDQGVVIDNGAGVATLGESPSDSATGKEIATASWVRARISESPTVVTAGTTALTPGTSALASGHLHVVYEE